MGYNHTLLLPFCKPTVFDSPSGISLSLAVLTPSEHNTIDTTSGNDSSAQAVFTFDQLWQLQKLFWSRFISPANAEEAKDINSTLLAPNVSFTLKNIWEFS